MPISVVTNSGSLLAQKYLRDTDRGLQATQSRVASGLRVATSYDDASTFAVAEGLRANIKGYTAVEGALGSFKAYAKVSVTAAEMVSKTIQNISAKIVQLSDDSLNASQRTAYQTELTALAAEAAAYINQANYNGTNILTAATTFGVKTVANVDLSSISIGGQGVTTTAVTIIGFTSGVGVTGNASAITANNALVAYKAKIDAALGNLGSVIKNIEGQQEYIGQVNETVQIGLGDLVDADLAKESAHLQSLQARQQLGVQAISIANQQPQTLLGLLR
jgi:flagellin